MWIFGKYEAYGTRGAVEFRIQHEVKRERAFLYLGES